MTEVVVVSTALAPDPTWRRQCELSVLRQSVPCQHVYLDGAETGRGSLEQIYDTIVGLDPSTIVLSLDGDDWLAHDGVVERVLREYKIGAWMTWGSYAVWRDHEITPCPADVGDVADRRACRRLPWFASHLKTFRAGLFQQIALANLRHTPAPHRGGQQLQEWEWVTECTDLAIMWPMLEMAAERGRFIPEVLYIYNYTNPQSVHNIGGVRLAFQQAEAKRLRARRAYDRLVVKPW